MRRGARDSRSRNAATAQTARIVVWATSTVDAVKSCSVRDERNTRSAVVYDRRLLLLLL